MCLGFFVVLGDSMKKIICLLLCFILSFCIFGVTASAQSLTPLTNLPTISIDLQNGKSIYQITKETQTPATFSMAGEEIESLENLPITIKGRGNSTWKLPKKPYQIKFDSKIDLLGMGKAKKWILLANYWDKTHLRNAITYRLANRMNEIFSVECQFVDVVINGQYQGCYLLCEKIEFGGNRIDEDTDQGAVLMELEQQYRHAEEGCDPCVITNSGTHITLKEPEVDEKFPQEELELTKEVTLARLNQIETSLTQGFNVYSKMIDVDSFVDWFIQNELAKNYDAAFVTSSYCYLDKEGILHMGPVWDVDVCFGNQDVIYPDSTDNGLNYYNYRADKGAWYTLLFRDETFASLLKERWKELVTQGEIERMFQDIDALAEKIALSKEKDEARWPEGMRLTNVRDQGQGHGETSYFTFEEEVAYLKDWLTKRVDFLNSQWNNTAFTGTAYRTLATTTGSTIRNGYGSVKGEIWNWNSQGTTNRVIRSSYEFFNLHLQRGNRYLVTAQFTAKASRTTDALGLRLIGYKNGVPTTLKATVATRVTYATAPKDADDMGTLYFEFDLPESGYTAFALVADIHSAAGSLGEIQLLQPSGIRYGDVNEDGSVNAKDALQALKYAVGKTTLTESQITAAKVTKDEEINAKDALEILKYAVEKIDLFPIEQ